MNLSILTPFLECSIASISTTIFTASRAKSFLLGPVTSIDRRDPIDKTRSEFCTIKLAYLFAPATPPIRPKLNSSS